MENPEECVRWCLSLMSAESRMSENVSSADARTIRHTRAHTHARTQEGTLNKATVTDRNRCSIGASVRAWRFGIGVGFFFVDYDTPRMLV